MNRLSTRWTAAVLTAGAMTLSAGSALSLDFDLGLMLQNPDDSEFLLMGELFIDDSLITGTGMDTTVWTALEFNDGIANGDIRLSFMALPATPGAFTKVSFESNQLSPMDGTQAGEALNAEYYYDPVAEEFGAINFDSTAMPRPENSIFFDMGTGASLHFDGDELILQDTRGDFYYAALVGEDIGSQDGDPSIALAALDLEPDAFIPLPATALLYLPVIAGVGFAASRRRRSRG